MTNRRPHAWCHGLALWAAATSAIAAPSALQQAPAPTALQQAQPAFGEKAAPMDPKLLSPKAQEPTGLKPAPGLSIKATPARPQVGTTGTGLTGSKAGAVSAGKTLFDLEDRAIIIVSGKQTTAGELKRRLNAELAAKAGPPKTVKGGARKLDLAALNATHGAAGAQPAPMKTMSGPAPAGNARASALAPAALSTYAQSQRGASPKASKEAVAAHKGNTLSSMKCLDKGPPVISEVEGRLKPGGKFVDLGALPG